MKDIKEYLEAQIKLSQELNTILRELDSLDNKEKELHYEENKGLRETLDKVNENNISATYDKVALLKNKINNMLNNPDVKRNTEFFYRVHGLNKELSALSTKLNSLEKMINKSYDHSLELGNKTITHIDIDSNNTNNTILNNNTDTDSNENQRMNIHNETNNSINTDYSNNTSDKNSNIKSTSHDFKNPIKNTTNTVNANNPSHTNNTNFTNPQNTHDSEKSNKKLEFKFGINVLNTIGVILILISLITFGKYVYTNYMSELFKGIFLFVISGSILFCGEKVFKSKLPKFSIGISALGVGGLYVSIIINYLVLNTINSVAALVLTGIITALSLFISYGNNSNVVRIISLLGAYICLFPMEFLFGTASYITIAILITINIANGCLPIKNKAFLIYSSLVNIIFCNLLLYSDFLEEPALKIYLLAALIINNFMYIKLSKDDDSLCSIASLCSALCFSVIILLKGDLVLRLICLAIAIASYFASKNKFRISHFINSELTGLIFLFLYNEEIGILFSVVYIALIALTIVYQRKHDSNELLELYLAGLIFLAMFFFVTGNTIEIFLYGTAFAASIYFLSDKYKEDHYLIAFKHIYLILIVAIITIIRTPFSDDYNMLLSCAIAIIYILINNNIERLKYKSIKKSNFIIAIISFILCNISGLNDIYACFISLLLGSGLLIIFTSEKYVDTKRLLTHKMLVYSLYLTYGVCMIFNVCELNTTIANIILSILLMIIALINVTLGFKLNNVEVRRYGLILSLIVCGKLLLIDSYSFNFAVKSVLFLVIGIIALAISYIYSKLENELKNKK